MYLSPYCRIQRSEVGWADRTFGRRWTASSSSCWSSKMLGPDMAQLILPSQGVVLIIMVVLGVDVERVGMLVLFACLR